MTNAATTQAKRAGGGRGARERILAAAAELFYFEGINATGVELIAAKSEVSKRTLYKHFPSKTILVESYLAWLRASIVDPREAEAASARDRLLLLFTIPEPGAGRMRGCPFHNAAVEAASEMPDVEEFVHQQKQAYIGAITDLCRDHGAADPVVLGYQIALLYEGAASLSTSLDEVTPWVHARAIVESLLDAA